MKKFDSMSEVRKTEYFENFLNHCRSMNKNKRVHVKFVSGLYKSQRFITSETHFSGIGKPGLTQYMVWEIAAKTNTLKYIKACSTVYEARCVCKAKSVEAYENAVAAKVASKQPEEPVLIFEYTVLIN